MSNKQIAVLGGIIAAAIIIGFVFLRLGSSNDKGADTASQTTSQTANESSSATNNSTATETLDTFTMDEVATHNTPSDCWTVINGNVYELTDFISRHDGGNAIEQACGIDGSSLFNERETSDGEMVGSGTPHSSSAEAQLERLKIGILAQ